MTVDDLISGMEPMIKKIASNFYRVPFEDLMQAGRIGVLKAYKNYKKNNNVKFSTYAYEYIMGEMYDLSCKNYRIKVNKDILRLAKQIQITKSALSQKYMREVTLREVADFLEIDESVLQNTLNATEAMINLDAPRDENRDLHEMLPCKETISIEEKISLHDLINSLSPEEQKIINYRYFEDLTQSETAKKMGMTQVMVSRYEKKCLRQLKKKYEVV